MAGLPGQESGNSLVDVLYGAVNPSGKTPWTIAKARADYGTDVLYVPDAVVPQLNFTEGLFIDYRHFDQVGSTPRFEFGFGMSYTTFSYSNLRVESAGAASSATTTASASGTTVNPTVCPYTRLNASAATFPGTISSISDYIYPYLVRNSTFSSGPAYPSASVIPSPAGVPGGAAELWDVVYTVLVSVENTGSVDGQEVAQLYLALGNGEPIRQLRGFNKTMIVAGQSQDVSFSVVRRDLSIWDVPSQSWVDVRTLGTDVGVFVGASSRDLKLNGTMPAIAGASSASGIGSGSGSAAGYSNTASTTGGTAASGFATMIATPAYVTEYSDGQPEAPVTEYSDGQPQVPTSTA